MTKQRWRGIKSTVLKTMQLQKDIDKEKAKADRKNNFYKKMRKSLKQSSSIKIIDTYQIKLRRFMQKKMINPHKNRRMQIFHLIVAVAFYVDFFLTGLILSNYEFLNANDRNEYFLNHHHVHSEEHEGSKHTNLKINDFMSHERLFSYVIFI